LLFRLASLVTDAPLDQKIKFQLVTSAMRMVYILVLVLFSFSQMCMNEDDGFFKEIFNQEKEEQREQIEKDEEEKNRSNKDGSNEKDSPSNIPTNPSLCHMNIYNSVALHEAFYKCCGVKPSFISNAVKYLTKFYYLFFFF
jgi:hypothetical protein